MPHREVFMSISVSISKRAEAYVYFATWCRDHKISPWTAAECIELCNQIQRGLKWDKHIELLEEVIVRLEKAGATDIDFCGGYWPTFISPLGEQTNLPTQKFI